MPFLIRPHCRFLTFLAYGFGFEALIALQVLSSVPAHAEWVAIGYSESFGGYTVYVDPDTVRHTGDLVKVWALTDNTIMQTPAGYSFLSSKVQNVFDCGKR